MLWPDLPSIRLRSTNTYIAPRTNNTYIDTWLLTSHHEREWYCSSHVLLLLHSGEFQNYYHSSLVYRFCCDCTFIVANITVLWSDVTYVLVILCGLCLGWFKDFKSILTNPNGIDYVQSKHRPRRLMWHPSYFEEYLCWKMVSLSTLIDVIGFDASIICIKNYG